MRTACLVLLVSFVALAQTSGGSFGSGGLSGGGSSTGGSRTGSGGSRTGGSSSTGTGSSLFKEKDRRPSEPKRVKSEWELEEDRRRAEEAAAARARREADFFATHRATQAPASISGDARLRPPPTLIGFFRLPTFFIFLGLFGSLAGVRLWWHRRQTERVWSPSEARRRVEAIVPRVDTRAAQGVVLSLGFDWTAREVLQQQLDVLSASPMGNDVERLLLLHELLAVMKQHVKAVRYARLRDVSGNVTTVEDEVHREKKALQARYTHDTVGAARQLPKVIARPLEGPGMLVVSVLVASRTARGPLGTWFPLERALEGLMKWTDAVDRLDVVWSPSLADDRLSSAELEVLYPELQKVGEARVGRVACGRCNAVYALELAGCPSCGAREEREAGKTPAPPCPWCGHALPAHETKCDHCGAFVENPPLPS